MDDEACGASLSKTENQLKELASLARLVAFAQQNAKELNADLSAHCLDLALDALRQELHDALGLTGAVPMANGCGGVLH